MSTEIQERFVKASEFYNLLGISKRQFYYKIQEGKIPPPIKISKRSSRWAVSEVNKLLNDIKERRVVL